MSTIALRKLATGPVIGPEEVGYISTRTTKLTYYNCYTWHIVLLPGGTRAVWPSRFDGQRVPGEATRYYRRPARMSRGEDRQPALALARA
jgi:hypothetical protein